MNKDQFTERLEVAFEAGQDIPDAVDTALADIGLPKKWSVVLYRPLTSYAAMVRNDFDRARSQALAASARQNALAAKVSSGGKQQKVVKPPATIGGDMRALCTHSIAVLLGVVGGIAGWLWVCAAEMRRAHDAKHTARGLR